MNYRYSTTFGFFRLDKLSSPVTEFRMYDPRIANNPHNADLGLYIERKDGGASEKYFFVDSLEIASFWQFKADYNHSGVVGKRVGPDSITRPKMQYTLLDSNHFYTEPDSLWETGYSFIDSKTLTGDFEAGATYMLEMRAWIEDSTSMFMLYDCYNSPQNIYQGSETDSIYTYYFTATSDNNNPDNLWLLWEFTMTNPPVFFDYIRLYRVDLVQDTQAIADVYEGYRFGYNGKMKDEEVYGSGYFYDYGFRMYDPRIARFPSADPIIVKEGKYPELSSYQYAGNKPIMAVDLDGLEEYVVTITKNKDGSEYINLTTDRKTIQNMYEGLMGAKQNFRFLGYDDMYRNDDAWFLGGMAPTDGVLFRVFENTGKGKEQTADFLYYRPREEEEGGFWDRFTDGWSWYPPGGVLYGNGTDYEDFGAKGRKSSNSTNLDFMLDIVNVLSRSSSMYGKQKPVRNKPVNRESGGTGAKPRGLEPSKGKEFVTDTIMPIICYDSKGKNPTISYKVVDGESGDTSITSPKPYK